MLPSLFVHFTLESIPQNFIQTVVPRARMNLKNISSGLSVACTYNSRACEVAAGESLNSDLIAQGQFGLHN